MKHVLNFISAILICGGMFMSVGIVNLSKEGLRKELNYEARSIKDRETIDKLYSQIFIYSSVAMLIGFSGLVARLFSLI